ncbi:MAG: hypothetical protein ACPGXK_04630 [Phycisphaerae bacterium]
MMQTLRLNRQHRGSFRNILGVLCLSSLVLLAACDAIVPPAPEPSTVTITFINESTSDIEVDFFSNADPSVSQADLNDPETSDRLLFTALAEDNFRYLQTCSEFGAAQIALASVSTGDGPGAMATTDILVDSMDFACGSFITFRLSLPEEETLLIDVVIGDTDPLVTTAEKRRASSEPVQESWDWNDIHVQESDGIIDPVESFEESR